MDLRELRPFAFVLLAMALSLQAAPDQVDYGRMLERDINGKQYAFLAGNHMYYIGGKVDVTWEPLEHETLGFTHPIFRDGRARGFGIAEGPGGVGHDKMGWEFWNHIRGAYGTVVIGGRRFKHPRPLSMIWRPDRVTCSYAVGGATITEVKFISREDVLCTLITADQPLEIEFEGQSFVNTSTYPTFDGDPPGKPFSQERTARGKVDTDNNAIHITEGGTILTKLDWKTPAVVGKIMYDGMSIVLSANQPLRTPKVVRDEDERQVHTFKIVCEPGRPVAVTYAMHDEYQDALKRTQAVLKAPEAALEAKAAWFNSLLNRQIPYFRCSDETTVRTYYYLWALYFMYFTYTGEGFEAYPHTQTAINNFMGLHLWDSWVYTAMGAWVADREAWGYGNVLSWKAMVPFKGKNNGLPDNFGTTWYSPGVWMNLVGSVELSWDMYLKSGDRAFLAEVYNKLWRPLYWDGPGPQHSMGIELNALRDLVKMAKTLGQTEDVSHWEAMHPRLLGSFKARWGAYHPNFYAPKGSPWKDIWHLASMMCDEMPQEWVDAQCRDWVMNSETGFLGPVSLRTRPPNCPPNGVFRVSTISTWLAVEGMFRHHRDWDAVFCTLNHINGMNKDLGFPVAPECWDPEDKPWGSLYYNWDGPITDLILKRLAGVQYSIPDQTFTVADHLPDSWSFLEVRVPIAQQRKVDWVQVRVEQKKALVERRKTVTVRGCPLKNLVLEPWLAGCPLRSASEKRAGGAGRGHARFVFAGERDRELSLRLGKESVTHRTLADVSPKARTFQDSIRVKVQNLEPNTSLRYSLDGRDPDSKSPQVREPITLKETAVLKLRAFNADGTARSVMPIPFTKATPLPACTLKTAKPGLQYKRFHGKWSRIPDVSQLAPAASGIAGDFSVVELGGGRKEQFALTLTGYVKVPQDGMYTFVLRSDDGSRLAIDGQKVVELDILCGWDTWTGEGIIALKKGMHRVRVDYFQAKNRMSLDVRAGVNGGPVSPVRPDMLFHDGGK